MAKNKNITLEFSQVELRMLYKCLAFSTSVEYRHQQKDPSILDNPTYRHFYDDLNNLYLRICDEYQDSCHLFGSPVIDY